MHSSLFNLSLFLNNAYFHISAPRNVEKKTPAKPTGLGGMPAIAMGDIQSIKDRLKKVNVAKAPPPKAEPKTYTDHNELKSKFDFFKNKEKEGMSLEIFLLCYYLSFALL